MAADESQMSDINFKPKYQASIRLDQGMTVRATAVADGVIVVDIRDDEGRPGSAVMTPFEAGEVASMLSAAERNG